MKQIKSDAEQNKKKPTKKEVQDKKVLEMSNLIVQRNLDAYKELANK